MLRDILKSGRFISVSFIKKDGTLSKVAGRMGVTKYLRGGKSTVAKHKEYITIFDLHRGYRNVNLNNIVTIKADGQTYNFGEVA